MNLNSAGKGLSPVVPHLIPLEYCTPERAARLLGCEVEDLFHWVEMGVVNLYAEFNGHISNSDLRQIKARRVHCFGIIPGVKIFLGKVLDRTPPEKTIITESLFSSKNAGDYIIESSFDSTEAYRRHGFLDDSDELNSPRFNKLLNKYITFTPNKMNGADIHHIEGFWRIRGISNYRFNGYHDDGLEWDIENSVSWMYSMCINSLNVTNMSERFRFKREDLISLHKHIYMQVDEVGYDDDDVTVECNNISVRNESVRVTNKQCRFIVALLRTHGFTEDDFRGSIGALRRKIAYKIPEIGDPSMDDKTLSDWLKKAGVRDSENQ